MKIFETDRLEVRILKSSDKIFFTELLTNDLILKSIPVKPATQEILRERFSQAKNLKLSDIGIFEGFFLIMVDRYSFRDVWV